MCGFLVSKQKTGIVDIPKIKAGLNAIVHRGPDNLSVWQSKDASTGLGHVRLSIIDLDNGHQPMVNQMHGISIVVNGEFYNCQQIRSELEAKGHVFETDSDSEILIFLYLEYGLNLFSYLRGEFSWVLYDEKKDLLLGARDRFGIKPFYYYQDEEKFCIASEVKALFALGIDRSWDAYGLMHAATLQYPPTHRTLFKNIAQLSPGHFLIYKNHGLTIQKYWDLSYPHEKKHFPVTSDAEYIHTFRELLSEAIKLRLVSDVPVCFHLSGGLDSSVIVGLSSQYMTTKKHCFTVSFGEIKEYSELKLAEETAAFTNSELHVIDVQPQDILTHLEEAVYYSEGIAVNGHITGKYLLNKAIHREGFKVALTGEGSDELLAGYPHLKQDLYHQLSETQKKERMADLYSTNSVSIGIQLAQGESLDLSALENHLGAVPAFLKAKATFGFKMHSILSDEFLEEYQATDFYQEMLTSYDVSGQLSGRHPVNQSLYLWTKLTLANYILRTLGDGCEMASSVEGRLPFLDHQLFEYCRNVPLNLKIRNGNEKFILKEAIKPYITTPIYQRQKHPFMAPPMTQFCKKTTQEFLNDLINSHDFNHMRFFSKRKIGLLLNKLQTMGEAEQTAYDPVFMFLITSYFLNKRMRLSS